jgi:hypothetical protein
MEGEHSTTGPVSLEDLIAETKQRGRCLDSGEERHFRLLASVRLLQQLPLPFTPPVNDKEFSVIFENM